MSPFVLRAPRKRRTGRPVRAAAIILWYYLLQTCVMPYLKIAGVMPNLLMVAIAILTVSYGKKYAFVAGALTGIILESMASNLRLFYALVYPSLALVAAQLFADMSDIKREMRRISRAESQANPVTVAPTTLWKRIKRIRLKRTSPDDLNPHGRIPLNALVLTFFYEVLMLAYVVLNGVELTWGHVGRIGIALVYTVGCAVLLMVPTRAFLGMYRKRRGRGKERLDDSLTVSEDALLDMAVVADMPDDMALTRAAIRGRDPSDDIMEEEQEEEASQDTPQIEEATKEEEPQSDPPGKEDSE
ncbi:MAG: hypothetical protein ACOX7B_02675 [Christensenellales bacterium]|jgi:hypothetical protein